MDTGSIAVGDAETPGGTAALRGPPVRLRDHPSPQLRRILAVFWIVCLLFSLAAQAGASWRIAVSHLVTEPAFASLGLRVTDAQMAEYWGVVPVTETAGSEDAVEGYVTAVEGEDIELDESAENIARRIAGPDGGEVWLSIEGWDGESFGEPSLTRSAANRTEVYLASHRLFMIVSAFVDIAISLLIITVAAMLMRRRSREPVAVLLSFMLLFMATVGTHTIWEWLGMPLTEFAIEGVWLSLLIVAAPAFPTGLFRPARARWLIVAAPVAAVVMVGTLAIGFATIDADTGEATAWLGTLQSMSTTVRATLLLAALLCIIGRFRSTPKGTERQQMKWATLGLGAGVLLYAIGLALQDYRYLLPFPAQLLTVIWMVSYALQRAAFVAIALGLLVSLLDYRLNDADAALGRSTGYAAVTTLIAIVWAVSTSFINKGITLVTGSGSGNAALATALSTFVALAVLTPARTRVMGWTEARFQRALVQLRSMPKALARWQHGDDPEFVAERALRDIVAGIGARGAALVLGSGERGGVLAVHEVEAEAVEAELAAPGAGGTGQFPLRLPVEDAFGTVATLLVGPRSDGASYSRDERAAIDLIRDPLADALRASMRSADLSGALREMRARIEQMEAAARNRHSAGDGKSVSATR